MKKLRAYLWQFLPLITLFTVMLVIRGRLGIVADDANFFQFVPLDSSYPSYAMDRWQHWTSRVTGEIVTVMMLHLPFIVWRVLDCLVYVLIAVCLQKIFNPKKERKTDWLITGIVLTFPLFAMGTAGWAATSCQYSWCLLAALVPTVVLVKKLRGEKVTLAMQILSILPLLYTWNSEQLMGVMALALPIVAIYNFAVKKQKPDWHIIAMWVITLVGIGIFALCPGNVERTAVEISAHFPGYAELSLVQKIEMGMEYTGRTLLNYPTVFLMTVVLLTILTYTAKKQSTFAKMVASFLIVMTLGFTVFRDLLVPFTDKFQFFWSNFLMRDVLGASVNFSPTLFLLLLAMGVAVIYLIWVNFKEERFWLVLVVLLGVGSQMIMSFSPSIYVSGSRTGMLMLFSFMILSLCAAKKVNSLAGSNTVLVAAILNSLYL